jgi:nucleotide-binding universal stress UspA family protein
MSLQGAIGEEKKLMSMLRERQFKSKDSARSRSTSANPKGSGNTTRSNSVTPSVNEEQSYPESITFQDPSIRLSTNPVKESDIEVSSEERLSEDEEELSFNDEGRILPNYSPFDANEKQTTHKKKDKLTVLNERKMMKKADSAKIADSILASERAISNAKAIGRSVPSEVINELEEKAKKAGTEIHVDPEEFYQERGARKSKLEEYAVYKKKLISSGTTSNTEFIAPYTMDQENKIDSELANVLNEKTKISDIDSDILNQRAMRTITRGNFFETLITKDIKHPKSFILCMDFSEESRYALEWCIGTVLVDSSVLYILNVLEDDEYSSMNFNGIQPSSSGKSLSLDHHQSGSNRERTRVNNVNEITKFVVDLLKLTKLQIHVVIESCHHPIPRHFIVGVIKHMSPTLVVVGSKGSSAIKGVLMGSLSNHLVRKSTVPVMVVRNRLKKLTKKSKFTNNITSLRGLADAKID